MHYFNFEYLTQNNLSNQDKINYFNNNFHKLFLIQTDTIFNFLNSHSEFKLLFISILKKQIQNYDLTQIKIISKVINFIQVESKVDFLFLMKYSDLQFLCLNYDKFEFSNEDKKILIEYYHNNNFNFFKTNIIYPHIEEYTKGDQEDILFKIETAKKIFHSTGIILPFLRIELSSIFFEHYIQEALFHYYLDYFKYVPKNIQISFAFDTFFNKENLDLIYLQFVFPLSFYKSFLENYMYLSEPIYYQLQNLNNDFQTFFQLNIFPINLLYIEKYNLIKNLNDF